KRRNCAILRKRDNWNFPRKSFRRRNRFRKKVTLLYPDRQTFFEKLALSLPPQPAIKIGPAPMPGGGHKQGLRIVWKAVPAQRLSTAQRSMGCCSCSQKDQSAIRFAGVPAVSRAAALDFLCSG